MKTTKAPTNKTDKDKRKSIEEHEMYKKTEQLIKQYKPYFDYLSKH